MLLINENLAPFVNQIIQVERKFTTTACAYSMSEQNYLLEHPNVLSRGFVSQGELCSFLQMIKTDKIGFESFLDKTELDEMLTTELSSSRITTLLSGDLCQVFGMIPN